jgi:hypothetical protein
VTAVRDLQPGDVFEMAGDTATVIVTAPHPIYRGGQMALVVWWLHRERRYSFDALDWRQELPGTVIPSNEPRRQRAWREALKDSNL